MAQIAWTVAITSGNSVNLEDFIFKDRDGAQDDEEYDELEDFKQNILRL